MSQRMSDVIEEYVVAMRGQGLSDNTVKTARYALQQLLAYTGNIQVKNLTDQHFDEWFAKGQARGLAPNTLNIQRARFMGFVKYAQRRRYISDRKNPIGHIRSFKVAERERLRIPADDFARVLDSTLHPRDRVMIALGLYLFLRASEIRLLKVGYADLDAGRMHVVIGKTGQVDDMPICEELDTELRRWIEYYQADQKQALDSSWFLVPAHGSPSPHWDPETRRWSAGYGDRNLAPMKPVSSPARNTRRALRAAGYADRDDSGKSTGEGIHTLRRSGARALFDELSNDGYDGAIRTVQAMLHHKSTAMTEHYLGIGLDKQNRNKLLTGRKMFKTRGGANVVQLRSVKEN